MPRTPGKPEINGWNVVVLYGGVDVVNYMAARCYVVLILCMC
jgi:hypothetical protein